MSYQEQTSTDQTVSDTRDKRLATHPVPDTLAAEPDLSRFSALVRETCDNRIIRDGEWITVLAPNNDALQRAGALPEGEELDRFIHHHISRGAKTADDIRRAARTGMALRMKDGGEVPIQLDGTGVRIGGASIVRSDIACINGVIHIIDAVLA